MDDNKTERQENSLPPCIVKRTGAPIMGLKVHLDDKFRPGTVEIGDITDDGMLSAKLRPRGAAAQMLPEQHFGQAHLPTELASVAHAPSTNLRLAPLPMLGMGRITRAASRSPPCRPA